MTLPLLLFNSLAANRGLNLTKTIFNRLEHHHFLPHFCGHEVFSFRMKVEQLCGGWVGGVLVRVLKKKALCRPVEGH